MRVEVGGGVSNDEMIDEMIGERVGRNKISIRY